MTAKTYRCELHFTNVIWLAALTLLGSITPLLALSPWSLTINTNNVLAITNTTYGAVGDGVFTNTSAIQSAINAAAAGGLTNGLRGGVVQVPAGVFVCGPLTMKSNVRLQLDTGAILRLLPFGNYPNSPYTGTVSPLITGTGLTNIAITGLGMIDGQGAAWWQAYGTNSSVNRPLLVDVSGSSKALLQDFTTTNPPVAHIVAKGANAGSINFIRVKLNAPATGAPNTDGIDFAETNALFQDCFISTGDDNIAIGTSYWPSSDMLVTNCFFGAGHGLSIGSYTSGGVSNLTVINCSFDASGIRIKSSRDRGGIVENLNYLNLTVTNSDTPINFYAYYEFGLGTLTTLTPQFVAGYCLTNANPSPYKPPIFRNIVVSNFNAVLSSNARNPFLLLGTPDYPMSNIVFKSMSMTKPATVNNPQIYNVTNTQFVDCNWVLPSGDKIQFWNADVTFTNSNFSTNLLILDGITYSNIGNTFEFRNAQATLANTNAIAAGTLMFDRSIFVVSNNLTLTTAAPITFVVGTNPVILSVKGNLTLGGLINVVAGPGFTNGIYTLITNTGSMSGPLPALGSVPPGLVCSLNTNTPKQLKLVVGPAGAPDVPVALIATPFNAAVSLQWTPVTNATSYNLKRTTDINGAFTTVTNLTGTNFNDVGLINGATYFYVVSALNGGSESDDSGEVAATPTCVPPPVPSSITALAGNTQVTLNWNSSFTATAYNVKRASVAAGPYTTLTTIATTRYTNTALANGTAYYYKISALNTCGESANSPALGATPSAPSASYRVNSGGPAVGAFASDGSYSGGGAYTNGNTIDTNGLVNPAPTSAYQTERYNNFSYTFTGLTAGANYTVRLHFAEIYFASTGARVFNVSINSSQVLTNFDIYAAAGAKNKAVVREFVIPANGSGQLIIQYSNVTDNAKSSAIEILSTAAAPVITTQPVGQTVNVGDAATFIAAATGVPSPAYQWSKNGTNLTGQTSATLTLSNAQLSDQGTYSVVASNSGGSVSSQNTALVVVPVVNTTPTNLVVAVSNGLITVWWPADHIGWRLEAQTNISDAGLGNDWYSIADSESTNQYSAPVDLASGNVFFRLAYP